MRGTPHETTEVERRQLRFPCRFCGADIGRWCHIRNSRTARRSPFLHATRLADAHNAGVLPLPEPIETSVLVDLLSLVEIRVDAETVDGWSIGQREQARAWAGAVHLDASDNDDVVVPERPAFLAVFAPVPVGDDAFPEHPNGATCVNCEHFKRCEWLISCPPTNTTCDWSPSRFVQIGGAS